LLLFSFLFSVLSSSPELNVAHKDGD
jgi:hypothetical protein